MRHRPYTIVLVLMLAVLIAGCSEDRTTVYLADIEYQAQDVFTTSKRDTAPNHLHEFGVGFSRVEKSGRWIIGEKATLHLAAAGQRMRLEIDCSTTPGLSERGQTLTILWNGYDLGTHPVDQGWQRVMVVGRVPPIAIKEGLNEIVLRPAMAQSGEGHTRPLSVFVKGVRLVAQFTAGEQAAWDDLITAAADSS